MTILAVNHVATYAYGAPVRLGKHRMMLRPRNRYTLHPLGFMLRPSRANIGEQIVNLARCDSRDHDGERVHVGRALLAFRTSGHRDCSLWEAEAERKSALAARRWVDDVPEPRIGSLESPFLRRRGI